MAPTPPIPRRADIDGPWLATAFGAPGQLQSFQAEEIGSGQMGTNVRYHLDWDAAAPPAAPERVVGKFPSDDTRSLAAAEATRAYHREVGFYQDLRTDLGVAAPRCWYAELDDATGRFVLILDDLSPAIPGDQLAGCGPEQAHDAVAAIATLHAPSWGLIESPVPWLTMPDPSWYETRISLYRGLFDGFASDFANRLNDEELRLGRQLGERLDDYYAAFVTPWCLTHGDFRLDNILFDDEGAWLVDWQTLSIGHGPADVGYFIATSFDADDGRQHLDDLVTTYRRSLYQRGLDLDESSADAIAADVELGAASGYLMAVIASQIVERTERGDAMFATMAQRSAAFVRDSDWWNDHNLS